MEKVRDNLSEAGASSLRMSGRSDTCFFNIEANGSDEPKITTIKLRHGKSAYDFDFEEESDGTRRLFDLMDMLLITEGPKSSADIYNTRVFHYGPGIVSQG